MDIGVWKEFGIAFKIGHNALVNTKKKNPLPEIRQEVLAASSAGIEPILKIMKEKHLKHTSNKTNFDLRFYPN